MDKELKYNSDLALFQSEFNRYVNDQRNVRQQNLQTFLDQQPSIRFENTSSSDKRGDDIVNSTQQVKHLVQFYCWKGGVLGTIGLDATFAFKPED
jgi:hypothetical protein